MRGDNLGLFNFLFKDKKQKEIDSYFETLNAYTPVFTSYSGGLYEMELTRACVDAFARNSAKLKLEVVGEENKELATLLQYRANPFMDAYKFIYRVATILSVQNNAFIVPLENKYEETEGFFPIAPTQCELVEARGELYLRYTFANNKKAVIEFDKVGVLNQYQYQDDFFGENNLALDPTMQLLHTQNEGIVEGVKNSSNIRFMAKISGVIKAEDIEKERESWTKRNLSADNKSGLIVHDNKLSDLKQIESDQFVINAGQQRLIQDNVFAYFGTNMDILQNKYSDEAFTAYYEGKIEPFAIQLSLVLTNMVYDVEEMGKGKHILASANRLQYMKNETKLQVSSQLFDRGILTTNDVMDIWNLPHVKDGDKRYIRKEYAEVNKLDEGEQDDNEG